MLSFEEKSRDPKAVGSILREPQPLNAGPFIATFFFICIAIPTATLAN